MWEFAQAIEGMAEACRALDAPVVSGNVSLYNASFGKDIFPTPSVGAVGVFADELRLEPTPNFVGTGFVSPGDEVWLLGRTHADDIGGSEVQSLWLGKIDGPPPQLDLALEKAVQDAVRTGIESGWIRSAHDCSEGGLAVAVAECLMKGAQGLGLQLDLP